MNRKVLWRLCLIASLCIPCAVFAVDGRVTALGRLEPRDGVIRVAGPSQPTVVIAELLVDDGDRVEKGQVIAVLDSFPVYQATVVRLEAELMHAENERRRYHRLYKDGIVSISERDNWVMRVASLKAELEGARVQLAWSRVESPIEGQVLEVHARAGERVGPDGIVELGRTHEMFAIAEVYETDISKLAVGQNATIRSPALASDIAGKVHRIGLKIGKKDVLSTDPAAKTDARVVEVEIKLIDSEKVAGMTNLQVEVLIDPGATN